MHTSLRQQDILATYACHAEESRGRLHPEDECSTRSAFQRDRDRIIHSAAFRRLEYKTQVFVNHEGDHYRTRLTHSIEVSQLARALCRQLRLDEDIAEAFALAHDLGHTPFGHAGEDVLAEMMAPYGGYDHNAQSLRILTKLEQRYATFDGLNLTWETLEGIAKHNGPLLVSGAEHQHLPRAIQEYNVIHDLELAGYPSAEAQISSLADDIAYNNHDIDDGIRAGLFKLNDLRDVEITGEMLLAVENQYDTLPPARLSHEVIRRLIKLMVDDVIAETTSRLQDAGVKHVNDIRQLGAPAVSFSEELQRKNAELKAFLFENMYRHYRVNRMSSKARRIIRDLFTLFHTEPECLPTEWQLQTDGAGTVKTAAVVADYIAGMTDRFAMQEHGKLFDLSMRS